MLKHVGTAIVWGQAAALLGVGVATLWWSQELMFLLLHYVGEEWVLGAENVVVTESGGKLLTNPMAMLMWIVPIWAVGLLQITAAITLVVLRGWSCDANSATDSR